MAKIFTKKGFEKIKKEIEYLKKTKRKEIAEDLKKAIAFGDLSENAAYHEAKENQAFAEGRILELESSLKSAVVQEKEKTGWVQVGSVVLLSSNGDEMKFEIVGDNEADPIAGKISYNSPLGKALMDKPEGAGVEIQTPEGKTNYRIIKIS